MWPHVFGMKRKKKQNKTQTFNNISDCIKLYGCQKTFFPPLYAVCILKKAGVCTQYQKKKKLDQPNFSSDHKKCLTYSCSAKIQNATHLFL